MKENFHNVFEGEQFVSEILFATRKYGISVKIFERWETIADVTVSCGNSATHTFVVNEGITETLFRQFENSIKTKLGFQNIFSLELELRNKSEISFTNKSETTRSIAHTFTTGKCTKKTQRLLQKIKIFKFTAHPFLPPGLLDEEFEVTERLQIISDEIMKEETDPSCNCSNTPLVRKSATVTGNFGNVTISYSLPLHGTVIKIWNTELNLDSVNNNEALIMEFEKEWIPEYIQKLSGLRVDCLFLHILQIENDSENETLFTDPTMAKGQATKIFEEILKADKIENDFENEDPMGAGLVEA